MDKGIAVPGEGAKCFLCVRTDSEGTGGAEVAWVGMTPISGVVHPLGLIHSCPVRCPGTQELHTLCCG